MKDDEVELCKYSTHTWTSQKLNKITNTFLKPQKKKILKVNQIIYINKKLFKVAVVRNIWGAFLF